METMSTITTEQYVVQDRGPELAQLATRLHIIGSQYCRNAELAANFPVIVAVQTAFNTRDWPLPFNMQVVTVRALRSIHERLGEEFLVLATVHESGEPRIPHYTA